jgi:hypothetical protein
VNTVTDGLYEIAAAIDRLVAAMGGGVSRSALHKAINTASVVASTEVREYAARFPDREDYEPLEELAKRVALRTLQSALDAVNGAAPPREEAA